ncbi:Updo, partial [Symbiodinium pilosum]
MARLTAVFPSVLGVEGAVGLFLHVLVSGPAADCSKEEEEEIQEDEEAKDNQEQTYQACLADACMTHQKNFGDAGKETEEESEMESALKHKKELRVVAADGECKE